MIVRTRTAVASSMRTVKYQGHSQPFGAVFRLLRYVLVLCTVFAPSGVVCP